jgi:thiosulfate dehydrogenase
MNPHNKLFRRVALPLAAVCMLAMVSTALAREPFTAAELQMKDDKLMESVKRGHDIWYGGRADTSSNGLACANCHPDAAASNPQTFPKFLPQFNRVVTYREMVNWCIENPQAGKALDVASVDMTALEAYSFKLHRGKPIEPGLNTRQTTGIAVQSGVGFRTKPTGIGFDK